MNQLSILEALRDTEFFRDTTDEYLQHLAGIAYLVEFPAQTTIFREHESASDVYILISGKVELITCTPKVGCRTLTEVSAGELIGWSPLVGRTRLSDTARSMTPIKAISIKGDQLLAMCTEHPRFGFEFMHRAAQALAQRLHATRLQLLDMTGQRLPEVVLESD
jgi:CRP-like cAMP-binding protein